MPLNEEDRVTIQAALQSANAKLLAIIAEAEAARAELYKILNDTRD